MSVSQFDLLTTFPSYFLPYGYYSLHRYLLSPIMCLALFQVVNKTDELPALVVFTTTGNGARLETQGPCGR